MKIISYNICNGAHGKIEELIAFLNQESPDVVCIQEANGWHENDFELFHKVGSCTGLIHTTIGMGDTPHHLITLSRLEPFSGMSLSLGNHHMAVNTLVPLPSDHERSVVVWNVHLNPYDEKSRLFEVEALPYAEAPHSADRIIVMGDFNFLCPMDDYPNDMLDRLREHGISKFGDKRLAYDAYMAMVQREWVDIGYFCGDNTHTVPTGANSDPDHALQLRLDYMFGSRILSEACTSWVVRKNELTDEISDHYPLVATFDL